jgi:antitoxin HicB
MLNYPAVFERDDESGSYTVIFPDLPEAVTQGETLAEAEAMARDCALSVLAFYIRHGKPIPAPSKKRGRTVRVVTLPALASMKVELYITWLKSGLQKAELARRLDLQKTVIERLFSLTHQSRLDVIEKAFRVLGKQMVFDVRDAA